MIEYQFQHGLVEYKKREDGVWEIYPSNSSKELIQEIFDELKSLGMIHTPYLQARLPRCIIARRPPEE